MNAIDPDLPDLLRHPANEAGRVAALRVYGILDTLPERAFDDLTDLAALVSGCPMAYISFIDSARQWLKSAHGFPAEALMCARDSAICADALLGSDLLIIEDLAAHPKYRHYPIVAGPPHLRFYCGAPLITDEGYVLGTLCAVDTAPHGIEPASQQALRQLARQVVSELELRRRLAELDQAAQRLAVSDAEIRAAHDRLDQDYRGLLDNMADGVLSVAAEGRVEIVNSMAAVILGRDAAAMVGEPLISALGEEPNDEFLDAVLSPLLTGTPLTQCAVEYRRGEEIRQLLLSSTSYRLRFGPRRGAVALIASFTDVTELGRLRTSEQAMARTLQEQHSKLQGAYLSLEQQTVQLKTYSRRVAAIRLGAILGVVLLIAGFGTYSWLSDRVAPGGAPAPSGTQNVTLTPRPVSSAIAVVGMVDAGSVVNVVGPFDGLVREKLFSYGGAVERGQPLARLDTSELEVRLREAQTAQIRARQRMTELATWSSGAEVVRARRAVTMAELDAQDLRSKVAQTKTLLDRGIVAAEEYRSLLQQQRSLDAQLQSARQDVASTVERGNPENRRIAEFEQVNADTKVAELNANLSHATVIAPVSGVVLQPPEPSGGQRAATVEVGSRVSKGQSLLAIGDLESLSVKANVDEIDVNKVRVGQHVAVSGDAFGEVALSGEVISVAAQAAADASARTGLPTFPVVVRITALTPAQRRTIRVGMSANLSIIAYEKADAIVVPPGAVHDDGGSRSVRLQDGNDWKEVPVTLGISTPDGVEVRSGLKAGDVVQIGN